MELAEVKHSSLWVQESSWLIHGLFRVTKRQKHLKQFGRTESRKCYFGKASGGNRNWTEKPGPRLSARPLWRHVVASCPLALSASAEWPALEMGQGCRPDYVRHWRRPEYLQEHKCYFFCVSVFVFSALALFMLSTLCPLQRSPPSVHGTPFSHALLTWIPQTPLPMASPSLPYW